MLQFARIDGGCPELGDDDEQADGRLDRIFNLDYSEMIAISPPPSGSWRRIRRSCHYKIWTPSILTSVCPNLAHQMFDLGGTAPPHPCITTDHLYEEIYDQRAVEGFMLPEIDDDKVALMFEQLKDFVISLGRNLFHQMTERNSFAFTSMVAGNFIPLSKATTTSTTTLILRWSPLRCMLFQMVLVDMHCKCARMGEALNVLYQTAKSAVMLWTVMVLGYARAGYCAEPIATFRAMELDGVLPDSLTFAAVLNACASASVLELGMQIHSSHRHGLARRRYVCCFDWWTYQA